MSNIGLGGVRKAFMDKRKDDIFNSYEILKLITAIQFRFQPDLPDLNSTEMVQITVKALKLIQLYNLKISYE